MKTTSGWCALAVLCACGESSVSVDNGDELGGQAFSNVAIGTWSYAIAAEEAAGNVAPPGNPVSVTIRKNGRH